MKPRWILAVVCLACTAALGAQRHKPQLPKSQIPDLGRPTKISDEVPLFNFDEYFVGKWTFEWEAPEGVLGPAGTIKGSVAYRKEGKTVARWLTDSRGYSYQQIAPVGGDLGGYFNLYYDGAP